ncbi:MAG TPA: metallophosphoesterase [Planctomycetota bacterium]|nr:metallophosphoesterase [Planctomycetota bacterium]
MERLRLAQLSDLHLGACLSGGKLALPQAKAEKRRADHRQCLTRFAAHVRETRPAAALIPGDLFDSTEPDIDDLNFAINTLNAMAPVPVFLAPGNHDAYAPSSCYNLHSALYQSRGSGPKWGSHIRIFTADHFESVPLPGHPAASVSGVAFHRHLPDTQRALIELPRTSQDGIRILLFHGSMENYPRAGSDREVLPFTPAELERAGYTYAAVGHYHRGGVIAGERGGVLGAYAGAAFASSLSDEGAGTWLDLELAAHEPLQESALHWHRCDDRAVHRLQMDVTGVTDTAALSQRLEEHLAAAKAGPRDLIHLTLHGRIARGVPLDLRQPLAERFFHAVVDDSQVEPDYAVDLSAPDAKEPGLAATSEDLFVWRMRQLYRQTPSEDERARIKEALYYGLDALTLGEVHLR